MRAALAGHAFLSLRPRVPVFRAYIFKAVRALRYRIELKKKKKKIEKRGIKVHGRVNLARYGLLPSAASPCVCVFSSIDFPESLALLIGEF